MAKKDINARTWELARKLRIFKLPHARREIRAGLEYGYPECCIAFFVMVWGPLVDAMTKAEKNGDKNSEASLAHEAYFYMLSGRVHVNGHVLCPACLLKARKAKNPKRWLFTAKEKARQASKQEHLLEKIFGKEAMAKMRARTAKDPDRYRRIMPAIPITNEELDRMQ